MNLFKNIILFSCLIILCVSQSGCSLLNIPGQLIGGTFNLLGQALQVADSLPKPPPWAFF